MVPFEHLCPQYPQLMDCNPPVSSVSGFCRPEYWRELPCPPPGDLPNPGIKPVSLMFPALAGRFFATRATWEAKIQINWCPKRLGDLS